MQDVAQLCAAALAASGVGLAALLRERLPGGARDL